MRKEPFQKERALKLLPLACILFLCLFLPFTCLAEITLKNSESTSQPERTIQVTNNVIKVTYHFSEIGQITTEERSEEIHIDDLENSFEYQGVTYEILNKFVEPITLQATSVDKNLTGELILPEEIRITFNNPISERNSTAIIFRIGEGAFEDSSIEKLVLPSSIIGIGSEAFLRSNIKEITLQKGILNIGAYAFRFTHCESIEIPESVIMLDYGCLIGNYFDLKKVTLPSTLRALGGSVFAHCAAIQDIYCYSIEPPIANDSDFGIGKWGVTDNDIPSGPDNWSCKIHVPRESIDLYKNAPGWKNFSNIVAIEDSSMDNDMNAIKKQDIDYSVANGKLSMAVNAGDYVAIYDLNGMCLKKNWFADSSIFNFSGTGIDLLKVNDKSIKIAM